MAFAPGVASALADALLAVHAGVVLFVVLGQAAIVAGGVRGWGWVRDVRPRAMHLALVLFIAAQSWFGALCPLTVWEQSLRLRAGQATYRASFIEHWLSRLLYIEAPWWTFVAAYSAFAALVAWSWWRWPPRRRGS